MSMNTRGENLFEGRGAGYAWFAGFCLLFVLLRIFSP